MSLTLFINYWLTLLDVGSVNVHTFTVSQFHTRHTYSRMSRRDDTVYSLSVRELKAFKKKWAPHSAV